MSKRVKELNLQMRADLMRTYREVAPKCWRQIDAYRRTVKHEAPRFYVSPKQAYQIILPMLDGDTRITDKMPIRKRKMYEELYERVLEAAQRREFIGKSLWFIIPWVVSQPAPEFYLSVEQMKKIFNEEKGWRRRARKWNGLLKRYEYVDEMVSKEGGEYVGR